MFEKYQLSVLVKLFFQELTIYYATGYLAVCPSLSIFFLFVLNVLALSLVAAFIAAVQ